MHLLILHIATIFGGAERTTSNLLDHLDRRYVQRITVVAPAALRQHLPDNYHQFIATDVYGISGNFSTWKALYQDARALSGLFRDQAADVALGMMHYSSALLVLGTRLAGIKTKTIASYRGPFYEYMRYYEPAWRRRLFLRSVVAATAFLSDLVIVPSQGTALELNQRFFTPRQRVIAIPNGIDHAQVSALSTAPAHLPETLAGAPIICAISRLSPEKNLRLLLEAMRFIQAQTTAQLIILGAGDERSYLEDLLAAWGLNEVVHLLGHHANVYPYLRAAQVFVHTCQFEGFGYTLWEALACNTVVVATDCPYGPREILGENEYGMLVPMDNPQILAKTILELLADTERREKLAAKGLQRSEELSIERMASAYTAALRQLV